MKHFITFAVIAISLLVTTGCKPAQDGPAQNPPAQDTVATLDSQQNAAAPAVNEPQPEPSVAQNPADCFAKDRWRSSNRKTHGTA